MSLKRKFASGAAWNVAGMSFDQLASFVIFVTLSRILSPKEFGLVALASIFVEIARPIVARGASDALIQRSEWSDAAASTAFWMNLLLCCVVAVLILSVGALFMLGTVGGSSGLICLAAAALVGSVFAVTSFLEGVRLVGPSTASLLVTVEVPVTIALAAIVLKQHLTPAQFVGAGLVVAAIVTMQLRARPRWRTA